LTKSDTGRDGGVVMAIRPRHSSRGQCSCGWVGKSHVLLSAAKCDALIHAEQCGCEPAIPLVQPEQVGALEPPEFLTVECPGGCGVRFPVPLVITDAPSAGTDDDELGAPLMAEAPELHDRIFKHLRTCRSARSWGDAALHQEPAARPSRRIG
jgi:hypothetical protein